VITLSDLDRYAEADLDRYAEAIEVEKGLLVRTASLDDVIRMKEAADRMKDHQALPEMRRLRGDARQHSDSAVGPGRSI
jgi:hypothetical protein